MAISKPPGDFNFDPSLAKFNVVYEDCLATFNERLSTPLDGLATGAIVFKTYHDDPRPRILLVQRASTDSMPNRWEAPGGAVDAGETILAGAVREVWEESGLPVTSIRGLVEHDGAESDGGTEGGYLFHTRRRSRILKFTFVVQVENGSAVKLDPTEHQDYVWATEDECRAKRAARRQESEDLAAGVVELEYTTPAQEKAILRAFSELRHEEEKL